LDQNDSFEANGSVFSLESANIAAGGTEEGEEATAAAAPSVKQLPSPPDVIYRKFVNSLRVENWSLFV